MDGNQTRCIPSLTLNRTFRHKKMFRSEIIKYKNYRQIICLFNKIKSEFLSFLKQKISKKQYRVKILQQYEQLGWL